MSSTCFSLEEKKGVNSLYEEVNQHLGKESQFPLRHKWTPGATTSYRCQHKLRKIERRMCCLAIKDAVPIRGSSRRLEVMVAPMQS